MFSTQNPDKPARAGKKWTDDDHNKLLALTINKNTIEEVASELERTVAAVKSRLLKEAYTSISKGNWTAEELSARYKLSVSDILRYQEREDEKKINPPEKRTTRSQTRENNENINDTFKNDKTFNSITRTQPLPILLSKIPLSKNSDNQRFNKELQTYEEKNLMLLTEIRDLLRIIADKK